MDGEARHRAAVADEKGPPRERVATAAARSLLGDIGAALSPCVEGYYGYRGAYYRSVCG